MRAHVARVAAVQVSGQHQIHSAGLGHLENLRGPAHERRRRFAGGGQERVVGHEHLHDLWGQGTKPASKVVDLDHGDAPLFPGVGTGGIEP
jgi:hypothetical protein